MAPDDLAQLTKHVQSVQDRFAFLEADLRVRVQERLDRRGQGAVLDSELSRIIEDTLLTIGQGIDEAVGLWRPRGRRGALYFWPGYQRVSFRSGRAILTQHAPNTSARLFERGEFSIGYGASHDTVAKTYNRDAQVLWYNLLLERRSGLYRSLQHLAPPSTHMWFEQGHSLAMPAILSVVTRTGAAVRRSTARARPRQLVIDVSADSPGGWASQVQRGVVSHARRSPSVQGADSALPDWPAYQDELEDGVTEQQGLVHAAARRAIYDLWLTACFRPSDTLDVRFLEHTFHRHRPAGTHQCAAALDDWRTFVDFIERSASDIRSSESIHRDFFGNCPDGYRAWHSLPIYSLGEPIMAGRAAPRQTVYLGTAMILCTEPLDTMLLELVSAWVKSMYLQLRSIETSSVERASGATQLANSFGHEVGKLGDGLLTYSAVGLAEMGTWASPPLRLSEDLTPEERLSVATWKVITATAAYEGFGDAFRAWGSVPLEEWGLEAPLSLGHLVATLSPKARAIAAARLWVDNAVRPESMEDVVDQARGFEHLRAGRPDFVFNATDCDDVEFTQPDTSNRFQFLVRLMLAAMSNAAYHAQPAPRSIKIASSGFGLGDQSLRISIINAVRRNPGAKLELSKYAIKTSGVLRACLDELGGRLVAFPSGQERNVARTEFTVALRLHADEDAWVRFIRRKKREWPTR